VAEWLVLVRVDPVERKRAVARDTDLNPSEIMITVA
jgi:hypothetical protein